MRALWLSLALLVPAPVAHALCVAPQQRAVVINDGVRAPKDGGLVVATSNSYEAGARNEGEASQPTWRFTHGSAKQKPVMVALAPGLVVYRLPTGMTDADLSDGQTSRGHIVAFATQDKALAAPAVATIEHKIWTSMRGSGGTTTVTLAGDAPATAVAMIVLDAKTKKPMTYGLVAAGELRTVVVYAQGRCSALPNGTVAPRARQQVLVRWVDSLGRVSATSKPITIAKV